MVDESELRNLLGELQRHSPRIAGSVGLEQYLSLTVSDFKSMGLAVSRDRYLVHRWEPRRCALRVQICGGEGRDIPIASPYPESGSTSPDGIRGPLRYLGHFEAAEFNREAVDGSVVVVDYPLELGSPNRSLVYGVVDGTEDDLPQRWGLGAESWPRLEGARALAAAAGACGMIVVWRDVGEASVADLYQPNLPPSVQRRHAEHANSHFPVGAAPELPTLWVGPAAGDTLTEMAQQGATSVLTLETDEDPAAVAEAVVATLPGASEDAVVLVTHSDGVNAIQENGLVALRSIARRYASIPRAMRPHTLIFVAAAGHLTRRVYDYGTGKPTLAEAEGIVSTHPEIIEHAVAAIAVEHLGVMQWVDDGVKLVPTSNPELLHVFTEHKALADIMLRAIDGAGSGPACVADAPLWGIAQPFALRGIPSVSYGACPFYLFSTAPGGCLEMVSYSRFATEVRGLCLAIDAISEWAGEANSRG